MPRKATKYTIIDPVNKRWLLIGKGENQSIRWSYDYEHTNYVAKSFGWVVVDAEELSKNPDKVFKRELRKVEKRKGKRRNRNAS